jgi:Tol biopolymer transport system component/DNA-binding winged helix-turn-helix (wHTH) protein
MPIVAKQRVHFGPFVLDVRAGELHKHDLKLKLQGHPIQILAMLLQRPGELITREEIQQKLWPSESETFVDFEHGLNTAVRKLRQVLGDEAETPQYIETLPRRGYRFVEAITTEEIGQAPAAEPGAVAVPARLETAPNAAESPAGVRARVPALPQKEVRRKRLSLRPLLASLMVAVLIVAGALMLRFARRSPGGLVVTGTRRLTYLGEVQGRILTDGRRIYFASMGENPLRYVSVNGGEATPILSPVSHWVVTLDISRDGEYLLLKDMYGPRGGMEAPIWVVDVNNGAARKLGDVEAQDAAFAPDGKTVVVAKGQGLYLTDMQGLNPVKLAEASGRVFWPCWSPDSQHLRFSVWDGVTGTAKLWELSRDSTLRQLFPGWKKASRVWGGEWTADGKYYLFLADEQLWYVSDRAGQSSPEPSLIMTNGAAWSVVTNPLKDTTYVSVAQGGNRDVFRWDLNPNHTPSILHQEGKMVVVGFSRDGQWIAYSHRAPTGYELWRARPDGSQKLQLTPPFEWIFIVQYSPDGSKIAIMADTPKGPWKVYWVSAEGGSLHEVPAPIAVQADPAWSSDSQSIIFGLPPESFGAGAPDVIRHLYRYNLRTGKTTEVPGSEGLFSPRSAPSGKYIAAMTADLQGLSVLDTTTAKWRPLTRQQNTNTPSWSPDSAWVYFNDIGDTGLWRVRVSDGHVEALGRIPRPPGYDDCYIYSFAPDGAALLQCYDSRVDIFALDYKEQK